MSDTESKDKNTIDVPPLHRGDLLISSPMLGDPNFSRTVILILDRDQDHGYIGLTLNRRMQLHLSDIFGDEYEENNDMTIFSGGPVDLQRLFWVHTLGEKVPGAIEVLPGIFVGGVLGAVLSSPPLNIPPTPYASTSATAAGDEANSNARYRAVHGRCSD